jgi:hypothetical protein
VWNLRLEPGQQLEPTPVRTTEFAPAIAPVKELTVDSPASASGYGSPASATSWKAGRFTGSDFALQPDGTLCCPAGKTLRPTEQRTEHDGSLPVLYAARILDCRVCPLREKCQWHGSQTTKPRRVSLLLHPLSVGSAPLLWQDWSRREHRRAFIQLLRCQRVDVTREQALPPSPVPLPIFSRAHRAHSRLSVAERLARNARAPTASQIKFQLFGVPAAFAAFLGLQAA